jgi:hypothetical protein
MFVGDFADTCGEKIVLETGTRIIMRKKARIKIRQQFR